MPFIKVFDFLEYRFRRNGKGIQATERTLKKGMGMWWRDAHLYRAKSVSLRTNCDRVVSQVFSAGLIEWECELAMEWRKSDECCC